jgi:uncharacterized RDD family membrane protein YckC
MTTATTAAAPAGFWRRYAAWSLDFALVAMLSTALAWSRLLAGWRETSVALRSLSDLLGHALADALLQGTPPATLAQGFLADPAIHAAAEAAQAGIAHALLPWLTCVVVLAALYFIGFEASPWQATPGKRALHLRVVAAGDDAPASLSRIAVRHAAGTLSWLTLNLGHVLAAVPPQKRALHDYIAGLRVIDDAAGQPLPGWARAWLGLQVFAGFAVPAWMLVRDVAALQSGLG